MIAALKDSPILLHNQEREQNLYIIPKDRLCNDINRYNRAVELFTSGYLSILGVDGLIQDAYGKNANVLYINGSFPPHTFSPHIADGPSIYAAGLVAFPAYGNFLGFPALPKTGLFVGFSGETEVDRSTQIPYAFPHTFGVISFPHIAETPYAWRSRLTGKTPMIATMGARNLKLVSEINPRYQGKGGLGELTDYLLESTTLEEARDVVQRGLRKDVAGNRIHQRRHLNRIAYCL